MMFYVKFNKMVLDNNYDVAQENTIAMVLFHFCTICEVLNEDEAITFKISSDDKLCEVYATATSSLSAGDTIASTTTTATVLCPRLPR